MNTPILRCPATISFLLHCHTSFEPYEPQSLMSSESAQLLIECGAIELRPEYTAKNDKSPVYCTTPLGCAWVELLCTTPAPQPAFTDAHGNLIKLL